MKKQNTVVWEQACITGRMMLMDFIQRVVFYVPWLLSALVLK